MDKPYGHHGLWQCVSRRLQESLQVRSVFVNDPATTEIYTLSLHDALPISCSSQTWASAPRRRSATTSGVSTVGSPRSSTDRKSTRLNSSHLVISYAVF